MGDHVIGSQHPVRPTSSTHSPAVKKPADTTQTVPTFNPAAKAIDDTVTVSRSGGGATSVVSLAGPEPDIDPDSQLGMNIHASQMAGESDQKLNAAWKELLPTLDAGSKAKLITSQRAWIAFRDAEASFAADEARGGSMAPLLMDGTISQLSDDRTAELSAWKAMFSTVGPNGPVGASDGQAERAKAADKALNAAYKKLVPTLDAEGKAKLVTAQRAWITFRDAECTFAGPALKESTLADMTEARTKQLQAAIGDR